MEGEYTPTIIQLIRSTDLAIIQLKDSHLYSSIPTIYRGDVAVTVILTWTICIIIDEEPCLRSNSKVTLEVDE